MSGKVFNETCVVTGEPARYRDPVTGQPYATLAAFKILRERFAAEVPRGGCGASACMQWWDAYVCDSMRRVYGARQGHVLRDAPRGGVRKGAWSHRGGD